MRDLYSDDYESVAGGADRLIPDGVRRMAGAAVFLALVAGMGLWAYRLGTRDAAEVPIIRAMEGPARIEPDDPGGLQAAHQGLEVNAVLAGQPAPSAGELPPARSAPAPLAAEDAPQGELVLSAPAVLAERVMGESGDLPVPPAEMVTADMVTAALEPDGAEAPPVLGDAGTEATEAAAGPRPRNRPSGLVVARAKVTPVKAAATEAARPAPAPAAAPAVREAKGLGSGTRLVQLGVFDSEEITRKAWGSLVARNGDLLSSKSLYIERTTANARVFYRLRVAGFESSEQTRQMCESLRGRGIDCIPVTLQ